MVLSPSVSSMLVLTLTKGSLFYPLSLQQSQELKISEDDLDIWPAWFFPLPACRAEHMSFWKWHSAAAQDEPAAAKTCCRCWMVLLYWISTTTPKNNCLVLICLRINIRIVYFLGMVHQRCKYLVGIDIAREISNVISQKYLKWPRPLNTALRFIYTLFTNKKQIHLFQTL